MKMYATVATRLTQFVQLMEDLKTGRTPALCVGLSAIHKAHFIAAAAEGKKCGEALKLAAAAASLAVSRQGAAVSIPERAQVEDMIQNAE